MLYKSNVGTLKQQQKQTLKLFQFLFLFLFGSGMGLAYEGLGLRLSHVVAVRVLIGTEVFPSWLTCIASPRGLCASPPGTLSTGCFPCSYNMATNSPKMGCERGRGREKQRHRERHRNTKRQKERRKLQLFL